MTHGWFRFTVSGLSVDHGQPIFFENRRDFEEMMLHEENKLGRKDPKYKEKAYIIT